MSKLDAKGRCCGRKPIVYKRAPAHLFCSRCDRAFDQKTGEQIENWAWQQRGCTLYDGHDHFERRPKIIRRLPR